MRILGIDPGLQIAGFGVVDMEGHALTYVASGTIKTTHLERSDLPGFVAQRLNQMGDLVRDHPRLAAAGAGEGEAWTLDVKDCGALGSVEGVGDGHRCRTASTTCDA